MAKDYVIKQGISTEDLLTIFASMIKECDQIIAKPALLALRYPETSSESRDFVFFISGKQELLKQIIWALDGTAENDGCEPKISLLDEF